MGTGSKRASTLVAALALVTLAVPAGADDQEILRRLDGLERRQREIQREMDALRGELAKPKPPAQGERVEEVERRQGILTEEVRKIREALVLPETKELKGSYGLGPAASKVYSLQQGLSIGGYGEFNYRNAIADEGSTRDEFDYLRFVLYLGYKFNDWIVLNTETELEHAFTHATESSGGGEVALEFANLDFLFDPRFNLRVGMVLLPMGFINEIHEPPFYHGNDRPPVEREILPSTWRSNGIGLHGELVEGLTYRTYGVTGFNAKGFRSNGFRDGRQRGNREIAEDFAWVGRVDYSFLPGTLIGGSAYLGNSGQDQEIAGETPDVFTQIYEGHAQARFRGLEFRALGAVSDVEDADLLSARLAEEDNAQTVAERMVGYYFEVAYDVLPLIHPETTQYLAPWIRYTSLDTQDEVPSGFERNRSRDRDIFEVGVSYKPIPQVVFKLDYRNFDSEGDDLTDELRIGGGFVF